MKITNSLVLQATQQLFQNKFDYDDVGLLGCVDTFSLKK